MQRKEKHIKIVRGSLKETLGLKPGPGKRSNIFVQQGVCRTNRLEVKRVNNVRSNVGQSEPTCLFCVLLLKITT